MPRISYRWMLLYASAALTAQSPPAVISIDEAVAESIRNNPGLAAERLGTTIADAAFITARLKPNPVLSVSADHLDLLGTGFNDANGAGPPEYAVRVDLPWERGRKRELRMDAAGYQRSIAKMRIADSIRRLTLDVTLACIDLMEGKSKLALANENLKSLVGIVGLNETRLQAGAITPVELTRSRVAMLQFRAGVRTAELTLTAARVRLQTLLGRKPGNGAIEGSIDIADDMKIPLPKAEPVLTAIEQQALAARPDLQAMQLDQARSQADLRLQIAQGRIDYTFGTEYRRQQGVNGTGSSLGFFFSAPLPVSNRNQGEIARATAEVQQRSRGLDAQRAQVTSEIAGAFHEYEWARRMIAEIERDLLGPSAQARDTTVYVYRAGASSLTDVLDAQRAFNETMSAYYAAQADYRRAMCRLAAAAGQEVIQ